MPRGSSLTCEDRSAILAGAPHMVGSLGALAGTAARKQADDLGVVVRGVDIVGPARGRNDVEQLGAPLQHLARAGVTGERKQLAPQLTRQDHGRRPTVVVLRDS